METTTPTEIEQSIFALPTSEQRRLIARVSKALRRRDESVIEAKLSAMAADPDIVREIAEIEFEFAATETDGLER